MKTYPLLILLAIAGCNKQAISFDNDMLQTEKILSATNSDTQEAVFNRESKRIQSNSEYGNNQLLDYALSDSTTGAMQGVILDALDSRKFTFNSTQVEQYLLSNEVTTSKGRIVFNYYLRDTDLSTIKAMTLKIMRSSQSLDSKKLWWRLSVKKFTDLKQLESDKEIADFVKQVRSP